MFDLGINISTETHLNPVIDATLRSNSNSQQSKSNLIDDLLNRYAPPGEPVPISTLQLIIKSSAKSNKADIALNYYNEFMREYPDQKLCTLTLNCLLECLIRNDAFTEAIEIFNT